MRRPQLVVMLKIPRAGRVKTRLGRDIGMTNSAWWFRHQVTRLLREVDDPRWQVVLAVAPDFDEKSTRFWPRHFTRIAQGQGDLGARMARIMRERPPGPVCIIGADIPGIRRRHIVGAFKKLGRYQGVFGPAPDGGYWLVGMKRAMGQNGAFENVRWSTKHALADSRASLKGMKIAMIDQLQDVDTVQDLATAY